MGERVARRAVVLAAAFGLPLAAAGGAGVLVAGDAGPSAAVAGATVSSHSMVSGHLGQPLRPAAPAYAAKPELAASTRVTGHVVVVVPSISQRVARLSGTTAYDIPETALAAYRHAEAVLATSSPTCHLSWTLLAAIGQVESDNGRYGGAAMYTNGDVSPGILGPVLDGRGGVGAIRDTDNGRLDGNTVWDRAVGPMQFIPSTWAAYGADGNGDGVRNPQNIYDAALAAADYLCAGGGDLQVPAQERAAILRYNHSAAYVSLVLRLQQAYAHGQGTVVGDGTPHGARPPSSPPGHRPRGDQPGQPGGHKGDGGHGTSGGGHGHQGGSGVKPPAQTHPNQPTKPTKPTKPPVQPPGQTHPNQPAQPPVTTHPAKPSQPPVTPTPTVITGPLTACDAGWCVGSVTLVLPAGVDLRQKIADFNGDGVTRTLRHELAALEGVTMAVTIEPPSRTPSGTATAAATQPRADSSPGDVASADSASAAALPAPIVTLADRRKAEAAGDEPDPVPVIVGADGVVVSLNGLALTTDDSALQGSAQMLPSEPAGAPSSPAS